MPVGKVPDLSAALSIGHPQGIQGRPARIQEVSGLLRPTNGWRDHSDPTLVGVCVLSGIPIQPIDA